jgi:hypothetical protein
MQDKRLQNKRDGIFGHQFNKDSSLLLHAIHNHFWWILKKPNSSLILTIITKKNPGKK